MSKFEGFLQFGLSGDDLFARNEVRVSKTAFFFASLDGPVATLSREPRVEVAVCERVCV